MLIDAKEGGNFIGRTEFDSPEVDNEVLIDASKHYLRIGDFANVKITRAEDFDLLVNRCNNNCVHNQHAKEIHLVFANRTVQ